MSWKDIISKGLELFRNRSKDDPLRCGLKAYDGSQWRDLRVQSGDYANLRVSIYDANSLVESIDGNSDAKAATKIGLASGAYQYAFNGSTWDRWRNNQEIVLLAEGARTGSTISPIQTNHNARGVFVILYISDGDFGTSPQCTLVLYAVDPINDTLTRMAEASFTPAIGGRRYLLMYPGIQSAVSGSYSGNFVLLGSLPLPRRWAVGVLYDQDINSMTYSLTAYLIV